MALDSCINSLFEAGNIKTDAGTNSTRPDSNGRVRHNTPRYSGHLLTAEGNKIVICQVDPPSYAVGVPIAWWVNGFIYGTGYILRID